ncbi:hypothetical protein SAMN05216267_105447 [Actinacidiphila rubida]|uniref:Uncharacterized protein n=1 Tax=Actinacidiphila rubida TaxID=310780 RepID=A0A1H8TJ73_9ACTN|nr:hypothetical protein [Actinacidiphila rubida]SEO91129.1 hypothetical protein SAMN05216267_105447 [Actinacidiphila rubida]
MAWYREPCTAPGDPGVPPGAVIGLAVCGNRADAALLPSAKELPADWLLERTRSERPRHVRVGAFRLLDACGGVVALRAAVGLFQDQDLKLRTWAAQSAQRWHPSPDAGRGDKEVGELLDRGRHPFSDHELRRRKWEAGVDS